MKTFILAFTFFTRAPLPLPRSASLRLADAVWAFPLVGALIGAIVSGGWFTLNLIAPVWIAAWGAIALQLWFTGALHEDGLADTIDGFAGRAAKEDKLRIMRDSHIGAFGVLALIIVIGLRVDILIHLPWPHVMAALIAAGALSRFAMTPLMRLPHARTDGLAAGSGTPGKSGLFLSAAFSVLIVMVLSTILHDFRIAYVTLPVTLLAILGMRALTMRQISGITGDVLGATQQITELLILISLCCLWLPA